MIHVARAAIDEAIASLSNRTVTDTNGVVDLLLDIRLLLDDEVPVLVEHA